MDLITGIERLTALAFIIVGLLASESSRRKPGPMNTVCEGSREPPNSSVHGPAFATGQSVILAKARISAFLQAPEKTMRSRFRWDDG